MAKFTVYVGDAAVVGLRNIRRGRTRIPLRYYHHETVRVLGWVFKNIRLMNAMLDRHDISTAKRIGQSIQAEIADLQQRVHAVLRRLQDAYGGEAEGSAPAWAKKALCYYRHEISRGMGVVYSHIRLINHKLDQRDIAFAKRIGQRITAEVMDIQHGATNILFQAHLVEDDQSIKSVTQLSFYDDIETRINWFRLLAANNSKNTVTLTSQEIGKHAMSGSKTMVRAQIDNLVSNAVHHARSEVKVTLSHTKNTSELVVEDDGPGFPVGEQQSITNLDCVIGEKGSESYYPHGHGLGLELVKQFASIQGADIRVGRSKLLGGALVSIQYRT